MKNIISAFIQKTKTYHLGTRWIRFQVFCRLPLIGVLYTASAIAMFANGKALLNTNDLLTELCIAINGILCLCALLPTLRLRPIAHTLNIAVAATMVLYGIVVRNIAIAGIGLSEIYYFVQRRDLFSSSN